MQFLSICSECEFFAFNQASCNRDQCKPICCDKLLLRIRASENFRVRNADMALDPEEVLVSADASSLDLTSAHLHSLEEVPIPETLSVR